MKNNIERIQNLCERLPVYAEKNRVAIEGVRFKKGQYKKGAAVPTDGAEWEILPKGYVFSGNDEHYWLYASAKIPAALRGKNIFLSVSSFLNGSRACANPQALVYLDGGVHTFDMNHTRIGLDPSREEISFYLYLYTGVTPDGSPIAFDYALSFCEVDEAIEGLYYDFVTPYEILTYTEEYKLEYTELLKILAEAANFLDFRKLYSAEFYAGVSAARAYLHEKLYSRRAEGGASVSCVGHTHIDIGWLWSVRQTREKAQRSFATVLDLMERYDEYKFMSSQAILYEMVKEEDPALYERIKARVAEGRWEAEGAMWVEADCNLVGGESLVRQILYGKGFFQKEFGVENRILWLPDAFGYSAAMPQILKKAGIDYFVTSKISWNDTNQLPYDAFEWQGIDGTSVFTYFLTAQTKSRGRGPFPRTAYNAKGNAYQVAGAFDRFQQKELFDEALITYGYGDGGGGTTVEDIERLKRLSYGLPACPSAKFETAGEFLDRVYGECKHSKYLPKWTGELYLEFHRGTYTSQAKNKRNNRKAEYALSAAETLLAAARLLTGADYPKAELDGLWKTVLTNQFHDILPGTGIAEVYKTCDEEYARVFHTLRSLCDGAVKALVKEIPAAAGELLVLNPLPHTFSGEIPVNGKYVKVENIPAKGYKIVTAKAEESRVRVGERTLENDFYRIRFNAAYEIESLYDKRAERELVPAGERFNVLRTYEDFPNFWDAWEIRRYYKEKYWDIVEVSGVEVVDEGGRKGLKITRPYLTSTLTQTVWLYNTLERVDFETELEWDLEHLALKALMPVDVRADKATYDIQFGSVERSLAENTSWDRARFEVCAHKYADLSENGYGVSVMTDCKYGYGIKDGVIGLTLLKCATYPDANADKGKHTFTYSVYAHRGAANDSDVVKRSFELNEPPVAIPLRENRNGALAREFSIASADGEAVVVDTVKRAEEGEALVVRAYECKNSRTKTTLTVPVAYRRAWLCDLMERKTEPLEIKDGRIALSFKPFEIVSVLLEK